MHQEPKLSESIKINYRRFVRSYLLFGKEGGTKLKQKGEKKKKINQRKKILSFLYIKKKTIKSGKIRRKWFRFRTCLTFQVDIYNMEEHGGLRRKETKYNKIMTKKTKEEKRNHKSHFLC